MEKREFLVHASQLYQGESEKLEQVCQFYKISKEIKSTIKSPIELFFYLDIGDNLCLNTLAHNLRNSELHEMADYVDIYKDIDIVPITNNDNITARVVKVLRDGLTSNNILELNYLLGTRQRSNEFETFLLGLLTKNKLMDIDIGYFAKTLKLINYPDLAEKLITNSKKNLEHLKSHWESIEKKRLMLTKICQNITTEDMTHLAFLFRLPIGVKRISAPIDLFQYLEDRGGLNLRELSSNLDVLQKTELIKKVNTFLENNEGILNQICQFNHTSIFEEVKNCLTREDLFHLGFLLGSKSTPKTLSDYIIQLVEKGKIQNFDFKFLETALGQIRRVDIVNIIRKIVLQDQNIEYPSSVKGDNSSEEDETKRTQLLELSRYISTEELEKLTILYNLPPAISEAVSMPIELFYYLERKSQLDIDYLKMSLSSIQRDDLISILEPQ